jgi:outer membrane protein assembly factor BamE (lipoprotein component of BamABCDE complex)
MTARISSLPPAAPTPRSTGRASWHGERAAAASCLGAAALALGLMTAGCTPTIDSRGHVPDSQALEQIRPGTSSRADVAALLGSPSSVATFDDRTWYYITQKTESVAFYNTELLDQRVIAVTFDDADVVEEVRVYDEEDAKEVDLVDRETATAGHSLGFFEQIFGNLGRFNREREQGAPDVSRGPSRMPGGGSGLPGG